MYFVTYEQNRWLKKKKEKKKLDCEDSVKYLYHACVSH